MRSRNWFARIVLVLVAAGLCVGVVGVMRVPSGSGYPWYSSLNTGPFGTSILFQALQRSGNFSEVDRNYLPQGQFEPSGAAVLLLGMHPYQLPAKDDSAQKRFEELAKRGNRVVLGMATGKIKLNGLEFSEAGGNDQSWSVKRWNIKINLGKENTLFTFPSGWTAMADAGAWQHSFGSGTVVILLNTHRLANRMLVEKDQNLALVPMLVQGKRQVWFDEVHLGVMESGSIAALMRRYRMQGLIAGLLTVTALILWRNAVRFPPAATNEAELETVVQGSDGHGMLTELLQRHVPKSELIQVCLAEFYRFDRRKRLPEHGWQGRDPVSAYKEITAELQAKRFRNL